MSQLAVIPGSHTAEFNLQANCTLPQKHVVFLAPLIKMFQSFTPFVSRKYLLVLNLNVLLASLCPFALCQIHNEFIK